MPRNGADYQRLRHQAQRLGLNLSTAIPQMKRLLDDYASLAWLTDAPTRPRSTRLFSPDQTADALLLLDHWTEANRNPDRAARQLRQNAFLKTMLEQAIDATARYPGEGQCYAAILHRYYCTYPRPTDMAIMDDLHLERSSYYCKKKEALLCCAIAFFGTVSEECNL